MNKTPDGSLIFMEGVICSVLVLDEDGWVGERGDEGLICGTDLSFNLIIDAQHWEGDLTGAAFRLHLRLSVYISFA